MAKIKPLRYWRKSAVRTVRRTVELSAKGPFWRLIIYLGKKIGSGRFASRCQAPHTVRAKALNSCEVSVSFSPALPLNPFHEESYAISWCSEESGWQEQYFSASKCEDISGGAGSRFKVVLEGLPDNKALKIRVRAVNSRGAGPWCDDVLATTQAKPSEEGGFIGPLGPAASAAGSSRGKYRWTQSKTEICLKIPVGGSIKAKDLKVKLLPKRLEIRLAEVEEGASDELLVGPLPKKVKIDELGWFLEDSAVDGRHIALTMSKADPMEKWPCVIEANEHPVVDTGLIRWFAHGLGTLDNDFFD